MKKTKFNSYDDASMNLLLFFFLANSHDDDDAWSIRIDSQQTY